MNNRQAKTFFFLILCTILESKHCLSMPFLFSSVCKQVRLYLDYAQYIAGCFFAVIFNKLHESTMSLGLAALQHCTQIACTSYCHNQHTEETVIVSHAMHLRCPQPLTHIGDRLLPSQSIGAKCAYCGAG